MLEVICVMWDVCIEKVALKNALCCVLGSFMYKNKPGADLAFGLDCFVHLFKYFISYIEDYDFYSV